MRDWTFLEAERSFFFLHSCRRSYMASLVIGSFCLSMVELRRRHHQHHHHTMGREQNNAPEFFGISPNTLHKSPTRGIVLLLLLLLAMQLDCRRNASPEFLVFPQIPSTKALYEELCFFFFFLPCM